MMFLMRMLRILGAFLLFLIGCKPDCVSPNTQVNAQIQAIIQGTLTNQSAGVVWIWDDHGDGQISTCTGVLVNNQWVLTAAHCVNDVNPSHYTVFLGKNLAPLVQKETPSSDTQTRIVDRLLLHPFYDAAHPLQSIDIALIHVISPFFINQSYEGYSLEIYPGIVDDLQGETLDLFGYGCYQASSSVDYVIDGNIRQSSLVISSISHQHLTFQSNALGQSSCFGDSGGPYFLAGTHTLVAIDQAGRIQAGTSMAVASESFRAWVLQQAAILSPIPTAAEVCENEAIVKNL